MDVHRGLRLREIADAGEAARRALEGAGLDFCCEGSRTLGDACDAAGVPVAKIQAQLAAVEGGAARDGSPRELSAVLDRVLGDCHPRTKRLLDEAIAAAMSLAATEPRGRPLAEALGALASHVSRQMREEEETLYARVRALADARMGRGPYPLPPFRTIHEQWDHVWDEHRRVHDRIRLVRARLGLLDDPQAREVRARTEAALSSLTEQMHLENNELLPRARDLEPNGYFAPPESSAVAFPGLREMDDHLAGSRR